MQNLYHYLRLFYCCCSAKIIRLVHLPPFVVTVLPFNILLLHSQQFLYFFLLVPFQFSPFNIFHLFFLSYWFSFSFYTQLLFLGLFSFTLFLFVFCFTGSIYLTGCFPLCVMPLLVVRQVLLRSCYQFCDIEYWIRGLIVFFIDICSIFSLKNYLIQFTVIQGLGLNQYFEFKIIIIKFNAPTRQSRRNALTKICLLSALLLHQQNCANEQQDISQRQIKQSY